MCSPARLPSAAAAALHATASSCIALCHSSLPSCHPTDRGPDSRAVSALRCTEASLLLRGCGVQFWLCALMREQGPRRRDEGGACWHCGVAGGGRWGLQKSKNGSTWSRKGKRRPRRTSSRSALLELHGDLVRVQGEVRTRRAARGAAAADGVGERQRGVLRSGRGAERAGRAHCFTAQVKRPPTPACSGLDRRGRHVTVQHERPNRQTPRAAACGSAIRTQQERGHGVDTNTRKMSAMASTQTPARCQPPTLRVHSAHGSRTRRSLRPW